MNTIKFEKFRIKGANMGEESCLPDIKNDDYIRASLTLLPEITDEEKKHIKNHIEKHIRRKGKKQV